MRCGIEPKVNTPVGQHFRLEPESRNSCANSSRTLRVHVTNPLAPASLSAAAPSVLLMLQAEERVTQPIGNDSAFLPNSKDQRAPQSREEGGVPVTKLGRGNSGSLSQGAVNASFLFLAPSLSHLP